MQPLNSTSAILWGLFSSLKHSLCYEEALIQPCFFLMEAAHSYTITP